MQQTIYIVVSQFYFLFATAVVINRIWIRVLNRGDFFNRKKVSTWGDLLLVLALLFALGGDIGNIILYSERAMVRGEDLRDDVRDDRRRSFIGYLISSIQTGFIFTSVYCVKGTILCFLLEITPAAFKRLRRSIWIAAILSLLGWLYTICIVWLPFKQLGNNMQCFRRWVVTGREEDSCFTDAQGYNLIAVAVVNCLMCLFHLATDIYIYTIPFFLLSTLPLITWPQRLAAGVMFGTGFLVVLLGATYLLIIFVEELQEPVMWRFWTALNEVTLAIAVPCLPALRVTLVKWYRHYRGAQIPPTSDVEDGNDASKERGGSKEQNSGEGRRNFVRNLKRGYLETNEVADKQGDERDVPSKKSVTSTLTTMDHIQIIETADQCPKEGSSVI